MAARQAQNTSMLLVSCGRQQCVAAAWTCSRTEQDWYLTADTFGIRKNMLQSSKCNVLTGQASKPEVRTIAYETAWAEASSTTPPHPAVQGNNLGTICGSPGETTHVCYVIALPGYEKLWPLGVLSQLRYRARRRVLTHQK